MSDRRLPGIMGERIAREEFAAPPRPGPIAGPPKPLTLSPYVYGGAAAIVAVALLIWLPGLLAPAARPALDPTAPTATPVAQEAAPAAVQAAPVAPSAPPATVLAPGAIAYDSPDGATLGDVSGRAVGDLQELAILEQPSPRGAMWVRADVDGAGLVWLPLGAFTGQAVTLADLPCRGACSPPTATAVPYVAPTAVYVAPTERPVVVATLTAPAAEVQVVVATDGPAPLPPTPCPIVMTQCQAPLVEVQP
jgi:hypothetical protein